jgi:hypothetical protein
MYSFLPVDRRNRKWKHLAALEGFIIGGGDVSLAAVRTNDDDHLYRGTLCGACLHVDAAASTWLFYFYKRKIPLHCEKRSTGRGNYST